MAPRPGKAKLPMVGDPPPKLAEIEDNSKLSEVEKREAVYRVHMQSIRATEQQVEALKAQMKALNKIRTQKRTAFKNDTGISLDVLDRVLKRSSQPKADLVKEAVDWHQACVWEGIPVGGQGDLIDALAATPTLAMDEIDARADGYRAGQRGLDPKPPENVPSHVVPVWMEGWHEGQARLAWALEKKELLRPEPQALPDDQEDDDSDKAEDYDPADLQGDIDREARRLQAGDFMERGGSDDEDDEG